MEADEVQERLNQLEPELLDEYADSGISSMKTANGTVYLQRTCWANAAPVLDAEGNPVVKYGKVLERNWPAAVQALNMAGLSGMVQQTANLQTLSAWVREQPTDNDGQPILPAVLEGKLEIKSGYELRVRNALENNAPIDAAYDVVGEQSNAH